MSKTTLNAFDCKIRSDSNSIKYIKAIQMYPVGEAKTIDELHEILESVASGYGGRIYRNENNCIALMCTDSKLHLVHWYDYVVITMYNNGHHEIMVVSRTVFNSKYCKA